MLKLGLNTVSSSVYHADREYLSSSVLKTILKDIQQYHTEYILGYMPEKKKSPALEEGSLTHTLILEPELLNDEFAFYSGDRKSGADFKSFESANEDKIVISRPQKYRCDNLVAAYNKSDIATSLMADTQKEVSLCVELSDVKIKVRADALSVEKGAVIDIKTTSAETGLEFFKLTLKDLQYDLSAALYLECFEQYYKKPFNFYFIVLSKRDFHCSVYKLSTKTRSTGSEKVAKALKKYKQAKESNIWLEEEVEQVIEIEEILEV